MGHARGGNFQSELGSLIFNILILGRYDLTLDHRSSHTNAMLILIRRKSQWKVDLHGDFDLHCLLQRMSCGSFGIKNIIYLINQQQ